MDHEVEESAAEDFDDTSCFTSTKASNPLLTTFLPLDWLQEIGYYKGVSVDKNANNASIAPRVHFSGFEPER